MAAMRITRDELKGTNQKLKYHQRVYSRSPKPLARWNDGKLADGLACEVRSTLPESCFCSFIEQTSKEEVVGFFREVARELEEKRGVLDYHLKVKDQTQKQPFLVQIFYGDNERKGPNEALESGECTSCFPGAPLYPGQEPGVAAGECVLAEFSDQPHVHCSLDAKARPGFVITPVRHVERMSDLQDGELFALWSTAVRALRQDSLPFKTMILNHGTYRNTPHLRLQVWVDELLHEIVRLKWSSEKLDLWNRLLAMAEVIPKRPCYFYLKTGTCREGKQCRFSHPRKYSDV